LTEANGHHDLGAFALGVLDAPERRAFERHLAECGRCRSELVELEETAVLLGVAVPAFELPYDLERRTLAAVARAAGLERQPKRERRRLRWRIAAAGVSATAAVTAAVVLGIGAGGPPGELELRTALVAPTGTARASVEVRKTGIGRVIEFRSGSLPILAKGEYYELWFVGRGDAPGQRNRISAGTFHPDEDGRSDVELTAAVDPALYPILSVTAEPGDGDPRPNGPEVLRSV
jgi:anti-sigma-K factor RskA